MAWRSGGSSNSELVDNLVANGLITCSHIESAFRKVDRKYFVPKGNESIAYSDQPLKEGNVHISAPHIYCSVLEGLELKPNSSLSFLNIGCGTGYFSSIVGSILGHRSPHFGVEIHREVLDHCHSSISQWKQSLHVLNGDDEMMADDDDNDTIASHHKLSMKMIHGNGLNILPNKGESSVGFDRIYVGAALDEDELPKIRNLLGPGGVLVVPVEDDLIKITRIGDKQPVGADDAQSMTDTDTLSCDFTTQIISCVRFAPLISYPEMETIISSTIWGPSTHHLFPQSFQESSRTLLLCSNSEHVQPPPMRAHRVNLAGSLPKEVWLHILSFTNRNWFTPEKNHTTNLKRKIAHLEEQTSHLRQDLMLMEARYNSLENERDMYRQIARQCHRYMQQMMSQNEAPNSTNAASLPVSSSTNTGGVEEAPGLSVLHSYISAMQSSLTDSNDSVERDQFVNGAGNGNNDDDDSDYSFEEDSTMGANNEDDDMLSTEGDEDTDDPMQDRIQGNDDGARSSSIAGAESSQSRTTYHHATTSNVLNSETDTSPKVARNPRSRVVSISSDDL